MGAVESQSVGEMTMGRASVCSRLSCVVPFGLVAAVLSVSAVVDVRADPAADFYRGKTIRMIIGYGPGGGYDLYGRLVAEFLPRHIPGNPTILPQNMPGAGSFVAAKYLAEVAPKDGTAIGSLAQTLALDSTVNSSSKLDAAKFRYLGRVTSNIDVGAARRGSGIKSFEDVRRREYTIGASGGGSTTVLFPSALNAYGGAKFKIVRGYKGTTEILLAMERGEVDMVGAYGLPGMLVSHPGWLDKGEAALIYQAALKRHRRLADVPTLPELAVGDEGRVILRAVAGTSEIGRSIITASEVPEARLAALRRAFQAMLTDADFVAACEKRRVMLDPGTGEEMDAIVRETLALPPAIVAKIGEMM
jgi:tripartite-type tricarboxylate transporter receptor subunit TctC